MAAGAGGLPPARLERQHHLLDPLEPFRGLSEAKAPQLGELELQVLDLPLLRAQIHALGCDDQCVMLQQQSLQLRHIGGQGVDIEHALIIRARRSACARDWLCLQHFASYLQIAVFWFFVTLRSLHAKARIGTMRSGSIGASVVRLVRRQSIPSSNIDNSALVNATVPVAV